MKTYGLSCLYTYIRRASKSMRWRRHSCMAQWDLRPVSLLLEWCWVPLRLLGDVEGGLRVNRCEMWPWVYLHLSQSPGFPAPPPWDMLPRPGGKRIMVLCWFVCNYSHLFPNCLYFQLDFIVDIYVSSVRGRTYLFLLFVCRYFSFQQLAP